MFRMAMSALLVCGLASGMALGQKGAQTTTVEATIKKVHAGAGALTVTVTENGQPKEVEVKVAEATKVTVLAGQEKKESVGKDGLKAEQFKEGAKVTLVKDKDDKLVEVRIGTLAGKKK